MAELIVDIETTGLTKAKTLQEFLEFHSDLALNRTGMKREFTLSRPAISAMNGHLLTTGAIEGGPAGTSAPEKPAPGPSVLKGSCTEGGKKVD